jgi:hypothetical protein
MSEDSYYLSIQSTSLAHYIRKALILPSRFYEKRPSDMQTIESDYLILSKDKFLNNSNCAIKIILNKDEIKNLEDTQNKNVFLYKYPIPISRIKKIFFLDETQKLKTIDNIQRGEGFISEQLIEVVNSEKISIEIKIDNYKYDKELEEKIKKYHHILGGLAFVRYRQDGNYSENYFSILSHFNGSIEKKNRFSGYDGAFTHKGKVWNKLSPLIYENISEDDVKRYAKEEDITIEKSNGVFKYENINNKTITYKLAILNTYGEKSSNRKKTNDLIFDCKNEKIPKDIEEGISLIYGINNGYSSFRNQYDKKIVKFKMDSLLDYYTIESVFQYAINNKKDNEKFEYIDNIGIKKEKTFNKLYKTYHILDETIITNDETIISKIKAWINDNFFLELERYIDNLFDENKKLENNKVELEKSIKDKDSNINDLKQQLEKRDKELQNIQSKLEEKNNNINSLENDSNFDEEKEKIIIEQTLDAYLKYDNKKVPELKKIAKEKGIKFTNKSDTIKSILIHKDNTLL